MAAIARPGIVSAWLLAGLTLLLSQPATACAAAYATDPWTAPTAAELTMKSIPELPGAAAVVLYKEQISTSSDSTTSIYVRIKILNESGKDYATVELPFGGAAEINFHDIAGRTIHSDGTVIPFTGKPFEKLIDKEGGYKYKVKFFTLPSVDVGSIIEYRYKQTGYSGSPDWYIQKDLFVRSAHYSWQPESGELGIAWTPILPPGAKVQSLKGGSQIVLDIKDVPPQPKDDMMPPLASASYRVLFYYTRFHTQDEFWKEVGEEWAKALDKFIGPEKGVRAAVAGLVAPGDTDEQKLRKIYALLMTFENVDFSRQLTKAEVKAQGLKDAKSSDDILARKRGSGDQLAVLFVAMARAAGLKAYLMAVADRSERLFLPAYLNFSQLSDDIAVVKMGGVDTWFDPGARYTPFGRLAWYHAVSGGLRETDTGTELVLTPAGAYKYNHISRVADLALDEHGAASGKITLKFEGDPARRWRERALLADNTALKADLKTVLEDLLPPGMEITVSSMADLDDSEKPFVVNYDVSGAIGSSTGKRLLVPANLFQSTAKPLFPSEKREVPIDMHFASYTQDAVRYKLPSGMKMESPPPADQATLTGLAAFNTDVKLSAGEVVAFRNVIVAHVIYGTAEYPDLRSFYKKLEAHDQEALILTRTPAATGN